MPLWVHGPLRAVLALCACLLPTPARQSLSPGRSLRECFLFGRECLIFLPKLWGSTSSPSNPKERDMAREDPKEIEGAPA